MPDFHEWSNLLVRMAHFIAGIMWIGTSFYFVWLDSVFEPLAEKKQDVEGETFMVHGGFFYRVEKRRFGAGRMPSNLHWFIWEATFTWISGFVLLWIVYYASNGALLIDPAVHPLTQVQATICGLSFLAGGWVIYDLLFRSPLGKTIWGNVVGLALAGGAVWLLTHTFSGRGAFIHLGAMFGTIMVLNVWVHILPNQRAIIAAAQAGQEPDYELGKKAKSRSMHNSYMTLPVLFTMISNHFASLTGHALNWVVLIIMIIVGAFVRHTMISAKKWPLIPALGGLAILMAMTTQRSAAVLAATGPKVHFAEAYAIMQTRCYACHSAHPTDDMFKIAPNGVMFDSPERAKAFAPRIYERAVAQKTMPFLNKTGMLDSEREVLGRWVAQGANVTD
jgi:uncharacterized membrane protein